MEQYYLALGYNNTEFLEKFFSEEELVKNFPK
jgi:hypothetical protein